MNWSKVVSAAITVAKHVIKEVVLPVVEKVVIPFVVSKVQEWLSSPDKKEKERQIRVLEKATQLKSGGATKAEYSQLIESDRRERNEWEKSRAEKLGCAFIETLADLFMRSDPQVLNVENVLNEFEKRLNH